MKEKLKNRKGITLIALVITIIILIIIAGVVINISLGNNGIFIKTKEAQELYNEAKAKEEYELLLTEWKIENTRSGKTLSDFLTEKGIDYETDGDLLVIYLNGCVFTADSNGNIIYVPESETEGTYTVTSAEGNKYNVLIKISNSNGIKSIEKPDGNVISVDNNEIEFEYQIEKDSTYTFVIKTNKNEKELTLDSSKINEIEIIDEASSVYPIISLYGVSDGATVNINYYQNENNYYSIDNGSTWFEYTNSIIIGQGNIKAKSIETDKITQIVSKDINLHLASDALGTEAYDNNINTSTLSSSAGTSNGGRTDGIGYINVDSSLWEHDIRVYYNDQATEKRAYISMYDSQGNSLNRINITQKEVVYTVPRNTAKIKFERVYTWLMIKEIKPDNTPKINNNQVYATITSSGISTPYSNINIQYYASANSKLYKINDGEWMEYTNGDIRLEPGETIYAKGIDKYGNETAVASVQAIINPNSLGLAAYDNNMSTSTLSSSAGTSNGGRTDGIAYINVDSSMWNKKIKLYYNDQANGTPKIRMYNSSGNELLNNSISKTQVEYTIPQNTVLIKIERVYSWLMVYEITIQ